MKISFITFGGREIGTGHLFRCLAIADWMRQLKLNAEISFHLYDSGFEEQNKALEILQSRSNYSCSIQNKNSIKGMNFDTVVLDLLDVPIDLMEFVKKKSNFLVSIDNVSNSRELSNIAINPLYYKINKSKINHDYIGPKFQIISHKFFNKKSNWKNKVEKILIIQGGSDPFGFAPKIAKDIELLLLNNSISLHVVVGPATNKSNDLINLSNKHPSQIVIHENIVEMSNFLENIDLAISSIGVVAFEIASMGIPAIHITGVEKELESAESMSDLGVSINMGIYNSLSTELLDAVVKLKDNKFLRKQMRDNCLKNFNSSFTKKLIELIAKGDMDEKLQIS